MNHLACDARSTGCSTLLYSAPISTKSNLSFAGYDTNFIYEHLGNALRDQFYLPLKALIGNSSNITAKDVSYDIATLRYSKAFYNAFSTKNWENLPSVPNLDVKDLQRLAGQYQVLDKNVTLASEKKTYTVKLRFIQSNDFVANEMGHRLILYSFYGNLEKIGNQETQDWDPKSLAEISHLPLEVLKALKTHEIAAHFLHCFSLGCVSLDSLKNMNPTANYIPKNFILQNGIASIRKTAMTALPAIPLLPSILYGFAKFLHLDANPEQSFTQYFQNMNSRFASNRNISIVQAQYDNYFSGKGDYDPGFVDQLNKTGAFVEQVKFWAPESHPRGHHALRPDALIPFTNAQPHSSNQTKSLAHYFLKKLTPGTTLFSLGGSRQTLDSSAYQWLTTLALTSNK
ncbi:MAG: hypothetical protein S4CHLAM6_13840 [Chlamydiae bacterium]|nr:hypothetical protein [Chlamydiota bacterium]